MDQLPLKKYYIAFGKNHVHVLGGITMDKDCIVEIKAETKNMAHHEAMKMFKGRFARVTEYPDFSCYPRGVIKLN